MVEFDVRLNIDWQVEGVCFADLVRHQFERAVRRDEGELIRLLVSVEKDAAM